MVDAARQMLDELMGRNRNLHPSEAPRKISWDDAEFCQYHIVKFCPHDLFVNTRADLGPCSRLHDDEAKELYNQARQSTRKRQYEEEFLRFCCTMLNDVDRKIQKGKQRLQLMNRDQSVGNTTVNRYQDHLNNLNARIKKLVSEAEEAGIRGDVDQAKDLMSLCEQLKEEKETLIAQHEVNDNSNGISKDLMLSSVATISGTVTKEPLPEDKKAEGNNSPLNDTNSESGSTLLSENNKKGQNWVHESGSEKQMEVCEVCGAFLIVGDAQQRIEDHLTGKQHLGYSRLRNAVAEIMQRREKEQEEEDRKRREQRDDRAQRPKNSNYERNRDSRDTHYNQNRGRDRYSRHSSDRHRYHHKNQHNRRSRSRSPGRNSNRSNHRNNHVYSRSRSRSHSRY